MKFDEEAAMDYLWQCLLLLARLNAEPPEPPPFLVERIKQRLIAAGGVWE